MHDLKHAIYDKDWTSLPKYPLLITFDDGWKENFDLIDTILKYNIIPTIFLTSHLIDTSRNFWTTCCTQEDKKRLKSIANQQRLCELKEKYHFSPLLEFPENRQVLNLFEISKMKPYVNFGLHTCFHSILTKCTEDEKREEIVQCKKRIEELLGTTVDTFSYPNGEYDDEIIGILKESGISLARTTDYGLNSRRTNPYKLKAAAVSDDSSINKLVTEICGISMFLQRLFRLIR